MKVLWLSFSFMTAEPWHKSLEAYLGHPSPIHWYDRGGVPDIACLDAADRERPEAMIYTGMADWSRTPSIDTFLRLRKIAPLIHISGDLSDPPYLPFLAEYNARECFDVSVNIDGNDHWPKREKDLTLLSPTAPQFFVGVQPLATRPIALGFAGSYSSPSRAKIIDHLREHAGLVVKPYDQSYGSYQSYANFLMRCRAIVNVPFSGSDAVRQVKGRILEGAMAGCLVFDHVESAAGHWFDWVGELAPYHDEIDLCKKVKDAEMFGLGSQTLANHLRQRVLTEHSPHRFWSKVFSRIR